MPVIPEYDATEKLDTDARGMPRPNFDTSAQQAAANQGAMVQRIGNQLSAEAARWQQIQEQKAQFNTRLGIDALVAEADKEDAEYLQRAPVDGSGLTQERSDAFYQKTAKFLHEKVPPHLREEYTQRLDLLREKRAIAYAATEAKMLGDFSVKQLGSDLESTKVAVHNDPNSLDERLSDMRDRLKVAPGIPDSQKPALMEKMEQQLKMAAAGQLHKADPEATAKMLGIAYEGKTSRGAKGNETTAMAFFMGRGWSKEQAAGLVGNLIHESRLDTGARNPGDGRDGSDSIGIAQWNAGRARALKEFAAARGKPATDYRTQLEFVDHELRTTEGKAGERLRNAKTAAEAAAAIVEAYERPKGSDRGAANAMGWAERRGHAERLSSGRVQVASLGGTVTDAAPETPPDIKPDPRFASLTLEERQNIVKTVAIERATRDAAALQLQTQAAAEAERERAKWVDQQQYAASQGKLVREQVQFDFENGKYKNFEEYNGVIAQIEKQEKKTGDVNAFNQALGQPGFGWNPLDKNHRDMVEAGFNAQGGDLSALQSVVEKTHIVPQTAVTAMRGAIITNDAARSEKALQIASNLMRFNPNIFAGTDGAGDIENKAVSFRHYVDDLGFSAAEATKRILQEQTPEYQTTIRTKIKSLDVDQVVKKNLTETDLAKAFNEGWTPFGRPDIGPNPAVKRAAMSDFEELFRERYVQNGDVDLSKKEAIAQMKKVWGTSEVSGSPVLLRYPPEKAPAFAGVQDPAARLAEQAAAVIKAGTGQDIPRKSIIVAPMPDGSTASPYKNRQVPPFKLAWIDKNGHLQEAQNPFTPDPEKMRVVQGESREEAFRRGQAQADDVRTRRQFTETQQGMSFDAQVSRTLGQSELPMAAPFPQSEGEREATRVATQRDRADEIDGAEMRRDARKRRREGGE